jgi:hypothetical protein
MSYEVYRLHLRTTYKTINMTKGIYKNVYITLMQPNWRLNTFETCEYTPKSRNTLIEES